MSQSDPSFPAAIIAAAQASERTTGCPACITLAQWALESNYGKAMPAGSNNPFGIKALPGYPYVECQTKEQIGSKLVTVVAKFRKFQSLDDAFYVHGLLLMSKRGPYHAAAQYTGSWQKFIDVIAPIYATDKAYGAKLKSIIEQHKLFAYNIGPVDHGAVQQ